VPAFVAQSKLSSFRNFGPYCLTVQVNSLLKHKVSGAIARLHHILLGSRSVRAIESAKTIPTYLRAPDFIFLPIAAIPRINKMIPRHVLSGITLANRGRLQNGNSPFGGVVRTSAERDERSRLCANIWAT
jgi:hypothetical protein